MSPQALLEHAWRLAAAPQTTMHDQGFGNWIIANAHGHLDGVRVGPSAVALWMGGAQ